MLSRLQDSIEASLQGLLVREEDGSGLFATEESPADDALPLPYHFSSHVLMWYTLRRLAALLQRPELQIVADGIHAAVYRYFPTTFEGNTLFSYVTDAHGKHLLKKAIEINSVLPHEEELAAFFADEIRSPGTRT